MRIPSLLLALAAAALLSVGAVAQSRRRSRPLPPQASTSKSQPEQITWEGTYTFQEGSGRAGAFVEHTIVISRQGDTLIADIDANGFQTSRSLQCTAKVEDDKLSLYFQRYREGNVFEPDKQGQFLLALARSAAGGRTRLLTYWGAYLPAMNPVRSGRVYFKKTN
jgi:hypothetical protein